MSSLRKILFEQTLLFCDTLPIFIVRLPRAQCVLRPIPARLPAGFHSVHTPMAIEQTGINYDIESNKRDVASGELSLSRRRWNSLEARARLIPIEPSFPINPLLRAEK